jgi:hypothetical protein
MDLGNNKEYENNKNKIISKKNIKIKLNDKIKKNYLEQSAYYNMINIDQFIDYFLIDNYNYIFVNDYDTPDGTGVRDYIHVEDLA